MAKVEYETLWLSDLHLGSKSSRAADLTIFLSNIRCRTLYLVGDIIDMWQLKRSWYWPEEHNRVLRSILKMAATGTQVIYVPGNHDDAVRQFVGSTIDGIKLLPFCIHTTLAGKRLLVIHGDQFDMIVTKSRKLAMLGGVAYDLLVGFNRRYNWLRRACGMPYFSLSALIKSRVKSACTYVSNFEHLLVKTAERAGVDGIVCGHIHMPQVDIHSYGSMEYYNCGDWVEHCSALAEDSEGSISLLYGLDSRFRLESCGLSVQAPCSYQELFGEPLEAFLSRAA
jgi:UDP-2,3-diacylglucosamine pyrophosphatase LpxH